MKFICSILRSSLLALSVACISGCVSWITGSPKMQTIYVLNYQGCEVEDDGKSALKPNILITSPRASAFVYSTRIIFSRDENTRGSYQYAFWSEPPPDRISMALESALRCSSAFGQVSRNTFPSDFMVRFEVTDFRHDISSNPGEVVVAVSIELLDGKNGKILDKYERTHRLAAKSFDAAGAVTSFNELLQPVVAEMVNWLTQKIGKPRG